MAHDEEEFTNETPLRPTKDQDQPGDAGAKEPPYSFEKDDEQDVRQPRRRKRRRRDRSILREDEPTSPFTLQQGWLDGLFIGPNMIVCLAVAFFVSPVAFFVALFAAITAADPEARRNALVVMGFSLLPYLLCGCALCIGRAINPQ